jgi:2'-5' RNA ligase
MGPDVPDALERLLGELRERFPRARWVRPENVHATLAFLGDTSRERIPDALDALAKAVADHSAFGVRLSGLGAFPSAGRPRILWLGLTEGAERLAALQMSIMQALSRAGFRSDEKPFVPHLTLARVRDPRDARGWEAAAAEVRADLGPAWVSGVGLMESELRREGARYMLVGERPLRDAQRALTTRRSLVPDEGSRVVPRRGESYA